MKHWREDALDTVDLCGSEATVVANCGLAEHWGWVKPAARRIFDYAISSSIIRITLAHHGFDNSSPCALRNVSSSSGRSSDIVESSRPSLETDKRDSWSSDDDTIEIGSILLRCFESLATAS
jgi:hypothetical protein